jgi:hypothetical protein
MFLPHHGHTLIETKMRQDKKVERYLPSYKQRKTLTKRPSHAVTPNVPSAANSLATSAPT